MIARWVEARVLLLDELLAREPALRAAIAYERDAWLRFGRGEARLQQPWPGSGVFVDPVRRIALLGA